jgi:hypothetical protein
MSYNAAEEITKGHAPFFHAKPVHGNDCAMTIIPKV